MNREQFDNFLFERKACAPAREWCESKPDATPIELWQDCHSGDWMLWLCKEFRITVPVQFVYDCANRALSHAVTALDAAGIKHDLRWCIVVDAETAKIAAGVAASTVSAVFWSSNSASSASAARFASAALWAANAARDIDAEYQWQADRLRELVPNPFEVTK